MANQQEEETQEDEVTNPETAKQNSVAAAAALVDQVVPSSQANPVPNSGENQQPNLSGEVDTSKLRSEVWEHMKKKMVNGKCKAVCKYCGKQLAAAQNSGTRHIKAHIDTCLNSRKKVFPQAFQKLLVAKQSEGKTTIANYTFDQDASRKDLVGMIVLHEYPLSVVEHVGFKLFVNNLQPLFKIPSRNTVRSDVLKLFKNRMKKTMALLDSNKGRVAVTTDMWTADNQKKSYMAVTAHFVDNSWCLQQRLLRFQYVPSPHTKNVLAEYLMNVLLDWNIDSKLSTITVDNCTVNDGVVERIGEELSNGQLLLSGSVLHMRCCAHILNLIVNDGLEIIGQSLKKIRESCVYWSSTPKKIEKFEDAVKQLHITSTKKLCYDVKTRWNSTYIMLETAIIYKEVFSRLALRDVQFKAAAPEPKDWENAEIIMEKLKIFFTTTELFSGTKYTTANYYFTSICEIRLAMSNWLLDSNPTIVKMASKMMEKFEKYWSDIHGVMGIATILDPRFKKVLIEYYYRKIFGIGYESEVDKVVDLSRQLFREYQRRDSKQNVEVHEDEVDSSNAAMKDFDLFAKTKKAKIDESSELDHFLGENLVPRSQNFNVLAWWITYGYKFPTLQAMARDIYAIPVSTVASESAFSMGGRIISPQRNRLHPQLVEALACAQNWLRAEFEDKGGKNPFKTYCDEEDEDEEDSEILMSEDDVEVS